MPDVFIVHERGSDRDYSSASRYGTLRVLLGDKFRPSLAPGPALHKLRSDLRTATDKDFFLHIGGDYMAGVLLGVVLRELGFRSFQFLRWEKERDLNGERTGKGFYVPVEINLT